MAIEPGQKSDPGLVVVRGRREDVAGQRNRRSHLPAISVDIAGVKRTQGRRGSWRDRGESTKQSVGVMYAITLDELRVVEVVAGVEPDTGGQSSAQLLLMISG